MKAIVVEQAGGPEVLQIRDVPKPEPREGWVLVRIKAFGLNRAELITRSGGSPTVKFPRVIGIECVGIVIEQMYLEMQAELQEKIGNALENR